MPEQNVELWFGGRVRAVRDAFLGTSISAAEAEGKTSLVQSWDSLLQNQNGLKLDSGSCHEVIIDFEQYLCGYPYLEVEGGSGASIRVDWAESLFEETDSSNVTLSTTKGHRGTVIDKCFVGLGDAWIICGQRNVLPALWWRSGRYLRIRIQAADEPIHVNRIGIRTTGYPFNNEASFDCDYKEFLESWPIQVAGIQQCAHEQWVDCPYYEQLSYVGDNICELAFYCLTRDDLITKRCLELFDWSRQDGGLVAERYPSAYRQDSFTYALLYPRLLREQAYWRDDADFISERIPGLRALMEECLYWRNSNGLIGKVPGWSFIDWVESWDEGCGPGVRDGDSSLVNLHLLFALKDYADIENGYGEEFFANRALSLLEEIGQNLKERYWCSEMSLMADDSAKESFSEHAQAWSILSGILTEKEQQSCLEAWLKQQDQLAPMSIYFSYYALDAFYKMRADDAFYERLSFWEELPRLGFTATPERPEPSRSDCHGWGAHPIYHAFSSIAGIRPVSAGFNRVHISPMPGALSFINIRMPHPKGMIHLEWKRTENREEYNIKLPTGVAGIWERNNQRQEFTDSLSGSCELSGAVTVS
ncbi:hypothetical protein GCM10007047_22530 [Cerasicoccus arenae]|uniref:Alpha-L-rhamnosidase n=2 Tax=Cerasicoccus arenae TaxID=424488 RepID=A0A8J3DJ11_9BACT|nr:hypothetical protein GCM10007047_22530 [Cerasicoccus arenae]